MPIWYLGDSIYIYSPRYNRTTQCREGREGKREREREREGEREREECEREQTLPFSTHYASWFGSHSHTSGARSSFSSFLRPIICLWSILYYQWLLECKAHQNIGRSLSPRRNRRQTKKKKNMCQSLIKGKKEEKEKEKEKKGFLI